MYWFQANKLSGLSFLFPCSEKKFIILDKNLTEDFL